MPSQARRPRFAAAAVLLLVTLGSAELGGPFLHRDDGCAVETHCAVCRCVVSSVGVAPPHITFVPVLAVVDWVARRTPVRVADAPDHSACSRAPPLD